MPKRKSSMLLVTDRNYLPVLSRLIEQAQHSIHIIAYAFSLGAAGKGAPLEIARKIIEAKRRRGSGLQVRVYLEGLRETKERNKVAGDYLARRADAEVRYGSTHAKGFCIDGRYVLFGSTNLTGQSVSKNNETNVLLDDPRVCESFELYFTHLWEGGRHGGIILNPPLIADGAFEENLLGMIDKAKSRLEFSIYFFDHNEIEAALIRAHKRGVEVTGFVHTHRSFAMSYVRRTQGTVRRLKLAGLTDIHYGPSHLFTHSKFLIRDRKELALGTGNWLPEDVNIHPQLYIRITNPSVCRELAEILAGKIETQARA